MHVRRFLRGAGVGLLSGAAAGILAAAAGRIVMRMVALIAGVPPSWSSGSLFLLIQGAVIGGVGGLLYAALRPAVRRWGASRSSTGTASRAGWGYGLVLLVVLGYPFMNEEAVLVAGLGGWLPALIGVAGLGALMVVYGGVLEALVKLLSAPRA